MSTLNVANITDGTDTVETGYVVNGSAKAWTNVGSDVVIDNSFNISSIVDQGGTTTGRIDHNFTNAMDYGSYGVATAGTGSNDRYCSVSASQSTQFSTYGWDGTTRTSIGLGAIIMGDLA